jgi:peptidoglycan/xylan/chitin deacetylase (PgdA/CDA1 family)
MFPLWILLLAQPSGPSVALTFDDATDNARINQALLRQLAEAKLESVLFVAGQNVDSAQGLSQVRAWGQAGHWIANHTYSHPNLSNRGVPTAAFTADLMRDHALLAEMPGFVRLFRFPFLREGDTAEKRDGVRAFLRASGYATGGVTIDGSDWYYDDRYRKWRAAHRGADPAPFRQAYLDHLWDRAQYYEGLGRRFAGRSVKHTLLLHTNRINADFLTDVIRMFTSHGWRLTGAPEAFADPIFRYQPQVLPAGQSVLWSLAKEKGATDLRYPGETEVYEKARLDGAGL